MAITIPKDLASLERILNDQEQMARVSKDAKAFTTFVANLSAAKARDAGGPEFDRQVKEQVQQELADYLRSEGVSGVPVNLSPQEQRHSRVNGYNKKAPGAKLDGLFEDMGDFLTRLQDPDHRMTQQQHGEVFRLRNAMSSTVPSEGGFLIPEQFRSEILMASLETSIVRPRAFVLPMSNLTLSVPMIDETSHASSVFGGIVGAWTEEGASLSETNPTFGRVKLESKKLTAYTEAPNELVNDAPGFNAFMNRVLPEAISFYEDDAFINGSGVGEPRGFLGAGSVVEVAKESGQAAATIVWENIAGMYQRMLPGSLNRAVWIANIDTFKELATMALSVGTGGGPVWIGFGDGAVGSPPMTILGRPLIFTEKMPTLGDAGDIAFVDLAYYLIGDRQTAVVQMSEHYRFQNDKTAYRIIERCDGRPWLQSAITPKSGSNTLSPFVTLAARA
jgi:HK97 family phage major capsid protein